MSFRPKPKVTPPSREECGEKGGAMEISMEDLHEEIQKALWHSFDMLDNTKTGVVQVSQLKVITSNIGLQMGVKKAEELLNNNDVKSMDFHNYFEVVKTKVLTGESTPLNGSMSPHNALCRVIKTCYKFCDFERKHKATSCTSEHCLLLWRLFNFLSETDDGGATVFPVQLHPDEAARIVREFIEATGQRSKENLIADFVRHYEDALLSFTDFLNIFEKDFVTNLNMKAISHGLQEIFDKYIMNVLEKGMMYKRGHKHKSWKERWLVLTPTHLQYYVNPNEKVMKGSIAIDGTCSVEAPVDRPGHKPNRFILVTPRKPYDMSAPDLKTKNEWISAIQTALDRVNKDPNIQKEAARERCCARIQQRRLATEAEQRRREGAELLAERQLELDEEKRKRLEDEELLKARLGELEEERKRREETQALLLEEQRLRELEQQRLRELEAIKNELERLLAEERQAKKDEEIVRNLQSKLLEEEFQRREELERLQQQQEEMLRAEREHMAVLEEDRQTQERLLREAKNRLQDLETEKAAAEEKMQEVASKLHRAEKDRQIIEEKVKLWKTPVGLARPVEPKINPHVTHRGLGAFCEQDFIRKIMEAEHRSRGQSKNPDSDDVMTKQHDAETVNSNGVDNNEREPEETPSTPTNDSYVQHDRVDNDEREPEETPSTSTNHSNVQHDRVDNDEREPEETPSTPTNHSNVQHDRVDNDEREPKETTSTLTNDSNVNENGNLNEMSATVNLALDNTTEENAVNIENTEETSDKTESNEQEINSDAKDIGLVEVSEPTNGNSQNDNSEETKPLEEKNTLKSDITMDIHEDDELEPMDLKYKEEATDSSIVPDTGDNNDEAN